MQYVRITTVLALAACLVLPVDAWAKGDADERIDQLEQEIADIKAQMSAEDKDVVKSRWPVEFYGFVAAQFMWGTAETQLYGGINSTAASSRVSNKATVPDAKDAWFSATPQNSRIGFKWTGSELTKSASIGGLFEMDFVNTLNNIAYGTSPMPRIRHFYLDIYGKRWSLIAGQTWDIFSPLNPLSLSLGGAAWYQGNMGFRRPQLRFTYKFLDGDVNKFKIAASADLPANTDDMINNGGIDSAVPYGELLIQYNRAMKHGDFIIAASGVTGLNRNNNRYRKTYGMAGSLELPLHKFFKISGEIHYGQNLGNMLTYAGATADASDTAGWGQVCSRWHKKFETNLGAGIDNIQKSKVAAGNVNRNQIYYGNFKFYPAEKFYFGVEYEYLRTGYMGNGTSSAHVILSNLVYYF